MNSELLEGNEYSKLLEYLKLQNKLVKNKIEVKENNFKEFADIPTVKPFKRKTSIGFNVSKFESLMTNILKESNEKLLNYKKPYISVTELCGCLRKSYFFRLKYKETNPYIYPYLDLINCVGNKVHEYVLNLYGYKEVEKTIISEKYKVKGRCDAVNENILIELKTDDENKYYKRKSYVKQHYYQSLIYSYILNTEYNYNIQTITLVYVLRNLKDIIPFDLKVDNKSAKSFLDNALKLRECINKKELIDPINSTEDECKFCTYKNLCKNNEVKNKKDNEPVFLL